MVPLSFWRNCVISGITTVCWIISFILKCSSETPLITKSVSWLFSWPRKSWRCDVEAQHAGRPLGSLFQGPSPHVYAGLPARTFRVRVGSTLSELHERGWGIHKLVLSPALFSIKITNIVNADLKGTDCSLFVQDFALFVWGKSLNRVERALQLYVNIIQDWVSENGFKFSASKMVCIHFHQQHGFFPDLNILLERHLWEWSNMLNPLPDVWHKANL